MYMCADVYACVGAGRTCVRVFVRECARVRVRVGVCVCMCVRVWALAGAGAHAGTRSCVRVCEGAYV